MIIDHPVEFGAAGIRDPVPIGKSVGPQVVLGQAEPLVRQRRPDLGCGKRLVDDAGQIPVDHLARVD
jgi:hypothetical protein